MTRIAYLTAEFPYGPSETFFRAEIASLAELADVLVVPLRPRAEANRYPDLPGRVWACGLADAAVVLAACREFACRPRSVIAAVAVLLRAGSSPGVLAKNLAVVPKALALAERVRRERIDHIHAQWMTTPATAALVASRVSGVPFSITAHQHDIFSQNAIVEKVAAARFVRVISRRNCSELQARLPAALAERCHVVHLGVSVPSTIAVLPSDRVPRLLCAARFVDWKGHRYLVEALARVAAQGIAFACTFAGDGPERPTIERLVAERGLHDAIAFAGNVNHAILDRQLSAGTYDVSVLASTERYGEHEGIPVALMEAGAYGLAIVATSSGSTVELLRDDCGIVVPPADIPALAAALARILARPEERQRLGANARRRIVDEFETKATTRALLALIENRPEPRPTVTFGPGPEVVGRAHESSPPTIVER